MFIKICGLTTPDMIRTAATTGADWIGLVFYPRSPRHLEPAAAGQVLADSGRPLPAVAVTVNADDALLSAIMAGVKPDLLQLHGDEPPQRVTALKNRYRIPVIKAIPVATAADLKQANAFADVADYLLLDAKPPPGGLPGGNRMGFDWDILEGWESPLPWLLAGGLTPDTVAAAVQRLRPPGLDVSSGVESAPGIKDAGLIRSFVEQARKHGT